MGWCQRMNISPLLKLKNENKEWTFAMVQYALESLGRYSLINKSELSPEMRKAVESSIEHYKKDYDKYSGLLKWTSKYKRGLKNG